MRPIAADRCACATIWVQGIWEPHCEEQDESRSEWGDRKHGGVSQEVGIGNRPEHPARPGLGDDLVEIAARRRTRAAATRTGSACN